jgi:hypothetical protein
MLRQNSKGSSAEIHSFAKKYESAYVLNREGRQNCPKQAIRLLYL